MNWIIEQARTDRRLIADWLQSSLPEPRSPVGVGFLIDSLAEIPNGFTGRVFPNSQFTVPHDDDIGAAAEDKFDANWGFSDLALAEFWENGATGQGVRIGIADSGIDASHPALRHLDIRADSYAAFDRSTGSRLAEDPADSGWHGTHCVGVIAGRTEGEARLGLAPDSTVVVARVLDGWDGSVASIKAGLHWLAEQQCDVVSLSIGWPGLHDEWVAEILSLARSGAVIVAASGNEYGFAGQEPTRSPANYPIDQLVSVGAYDHNRVVWGRSGGGEIVWPPDSAFSELRGVVPAIVCPGVDIQSATPTGLYKTASGTSMATPHLAGIVACAISHLKAQGDANPNARALELLKNSMVDLGNLGPDVRYGNGALDGTRYLELVLANSAS